MPLFCHGDEKVKAVGKKFSFVQRKLYRYNNPFKNTLQTFSDLEIQAKKCLPTADCVLMVICRGIDHHTKNTLNCKLIMISKYFLF